jgi:lysophospholipase L1-like esterase
MYFCLGPGLLLTMKKTLLMVYILAGLGLLRADAPAGASAYNFVFIGDSITQGVGTENHQTQAAPCVAMYYLARALGADAVYASNQGHAGHTTTDFLPGGQDFPLLEAAVKTLQSQHPGQLVFPVMLGTNDCANSGTNGSPATAETYEKNLRATIDALLAEYPGAKFVLNHPIWFSPNTHNGADYEGSAAADRLKSYFGVMDRLVAEYAASHPGHVFLGDTQGYNYFSIHFQTELNGETGVNGTFYVHPNQAGAESLGKFWAAAIAKNFK